MSLTDFERETIVRWSDGDEPLTIYTHRKAKALRLIQAGAKLKAESKSAEGKVHAWTLEVPKEWFRWPRKPRAISPERREVLVEQGRKLQKGGLIKGSGDQTA